jgi:hypothetical protein
MASTGFVLCYNSVYITSIICYLEPIEPICSGAYSGSALPTREDLTSDTIEAATQINVQDSTFIFTLGIRNRMPSYTGHHYEKQRAI